jgi:hypothetical protein
MLLVEVTVSIYAAKYDRKFVLPGVAGHVGGRCLRAAGKYSLKMKLTTKSIDIQGHKCSRIAITRQEKSCNRPELIDLITNRC